MENSMQHLKELLGKAIQIADATEKYYHIEAIEQYYSSYNLWLRYSPIPSRPILERAWFEAGILAETSVFLAVHGFYEQACAILRMQLDGFLTRFYWDTLDKRAELESHTIVDRLTNGYWEWERGEAKDYPRINKVWLTLRKEKYFDSFDRQYNLRMNIENQNQLLHKYIHGRPPSRHYPGATRSSRINIKFEKRHFDEWFGLFKSTYNLMTIMSVLLYPDYLKCSSWHKFILLEPERLNQINMTINIKD